MLYECMVPVPIAIWNGETGLAQDYLREHAMNCAAMMAEKNDCHSPRLTAEGVETFEGHGTSHYVFRFAADRVGRA